MPSTAALTHVASCAWRSRGGTRTRVSALTRATAASPCSGNRGSSARAVTEEPWQVVHALILHTLLTTSRSAKNDSKPTAMGMIASANRALTRLARARRRELRAQDRSQLFDERWSSVCDPSSRVLRVDVLGAHPVPCTPQHAMSARMVYTDGSHATQQRNAHAGWSFVVAMPSAELDMTETPKGLAPSSSQIKFEFASCGRVATRPLEPGYDGATRASNNTGELTALLRAVRWEATQGGDRPVCFHVDSCCAVCAPPGTL